MAAILLLKTRDYRPDGSFTEVVVWRVPTPVSGSSHRYKYSLAFVLEGRCVVRFDNERGKGDHKHVRDAETPYAFTTVSALLADFAKEIERWIP